MSLLPSVDETTPSDVFTLQENEITTIDKNVVGVIYVKKINLGFNSQWVKHFFHLNLELDNISYWKSYPSRKKKRIYLTKKNYYLKKEKCKYFVKIKICKKSKYLSRTILKLKTYNINGAELLYNNLQNIINSVDVLV